jgi:hypothetical protein
MAKIRQSNLDNSVVTGLTELTSGNVATTDQTIIYDASSGTLKRITQQNFLNFPNVSSVSPTSVTSGDGTGNYTFTITGSGFTDASASLVNTSGTTVNFDTVTVDSSTQITAVIAKSSLSSSGEPYDVKVTAATGLANTLENQINIDASPTYNTAAGSLGNVADGARASVSFDIEAYDPESAGNVTFEIQSGSLPAGATTSTVNENGVSKFRISGTFTAVGSNTTSNFVVRAADANSNTSSRAFSITVLTPTSESFTSSGTFSVPSGVSVVDVLVVGGGGSGGYQHAGGGGAGGLVFRPAFPVTPGGTVSVTVGCGGAGAPGSQPTYPNRNGQDSVFGTLTAKGGGQGGSGCQADNPSSNRCGPGVAGDGGSGGGSGYCTSYPCGGSATQPTQPGDSGAYGFGNNGGASTGSGGSKAGGGGGGAGAAGQTSTNACGGDGGAGKAYTIANGTTPVYYAGGGGGANHQPGAGGTGGQGGGGTGGTGPVGQNGAPPSGAIAATNGQANKGGGGGGSHHAFQQSTYSNTPACQVLGGRGIVIVRY